MSNLPLLSLMLAAPLAGAMLIWCMPEARAARWIATASGGLTLALALAAVASFEPGRADFQLVEQLRWIRALNVDYLVGVDGLSVLFLPAGAALFLAVMFSGWNSVSTMPRLWYSLLLALETATLGVFCALDAILFFLFWELTLVPLYFLLALWGGGPHRRQAAAKYVHVMLAGGVPLLFGLLAAAFHHAEMAGNAVPSGLVWDLRQWLAVPLAAEAQFGLFLLLVLGFGVKTPLFPLHTWLPAVAVEGPAGAAALLTGLKLGAYGLIRIAVPLAPHAAQELYWLLAALGTLGMLYGAAAALAQTNLRRMLAYASFSHVGLVVLGIASFNVAGLEGALMQLLNFTLVAGGLFLMTSWLHGRTGSTDVAHLGGVARTMPLAATFFLILGLASIGVPGTSGFPAELLILLSVFKAHVGVGIAVLVGMVLGAATLTGAYRRAFLGPLGRPELAQAQDLRPREFAIAGIFAAAVLVIGLSPAPLLDFLRPAAEAWVARLPTVAQ